MSDALCGPSNALQQFKQQTSLDRTLQQDRLASRQPPSQAFRSRDPLAGRLDADFEAFQAGVPLPDLPAYQQPLHPNAFAQPSHTPSWAADFSRMQISPGTAAHQQNTLSTAGASGANWTQGFREQMSHHAPRTQTSASSPQAFQHMARYGMGGFQSSFTQPSFASSTLSSKGKEPAVEEFDEAAFERAFTQASLDLMEESETTAEALQDQTPAYEAGASTANYPYDSQSHKDLQDQVHHLSQDEARALEDANLADTLAHVEDPVDLAAADAIMAEPEEQHVHSKQADDDALAATAKELLEKVQHNQTDKFKNSQFLNLMRKLRDREMRVEGDQMVETAASTSIETHSAQGLDTAKHIPVFDNSEQRPSPLGPIDSTLVDTRPLDYAGAIPQHEQDHDAGRINPLDGQDVVDHLNRRWASPDDIDDYDPEPVENYGNFPPFSQSRPWRTQPPPSHSA